MDDRDRAWIDFETEHPGHSPRKEHLIYTVLGVSPATYYQRLLLLARSPEAIAYAPTTLYRVANRPKR